MRNVHKVHNVIGEETLPYNVSQYLKSLESIQGEFS